MEKQKRKLWLGVAFGAGALIGTAFYFGGGSGKGKFGSLPSNAFGPKGGDGVGNGRASSIGNGVGSGGQEGHGFADGGGGVKNG